MPNTPTRPVSTLDKRSAAEYSDPAAGWPCAPHPANDNWRRRPEQAHQFRSAFIDSARPLTDLVPRFSSQDRGGLDPRSPCQPHAVDPAFPFRNNLLKGVGLMQSGI